LTDEDDFGATSASAKNGLGATLLKITSFTIRGRIAKSFQAFSFGKEICR